MFRNRNTTFLYIALTIGILFGACSPKIPKVTLPISDSQNHSLITSLKVNVMYTGLVNPFTIEVPNVHRDSVKVSVSQGKIKRYWNSNSYEIVPESVGKMHIFVDWKDNNGVQRDSFMYRVKAVPNPIPYVGIQRDAENKDRMNRADFLRVSSLGLLVENFDFEAVCKSFGFEVLRINNEGDRSSVYNEEARFSKKTKTFLAQAGQGDIFIFRNIIYRCPGDSVDVERRLLNFAVEIE